MKKLFKFIFIFLICFNFVSFTVFANETTTDEEIPSIEEEKYNITYVLNDADTNDNKTEYVAGETYILKEPTRKCYTFLGWYEDETFTTASKIEQIDADRTGDIVLYARWQCMGYYVQFMDGYASSNFILPGFIYTIEDEKIDLTDEQYIPVKEGYKFLGWYDQNTMKEVKQLGDGVAGYVLLYAKWEKITEEEKYTITYVDSGLTHDNPLEYVYGTEVILTQAYKTGYTFLGWYEDKEKTIPIDKIDATRRENLTLYGKWEVRNYKITFDTDGGDEVKAINYYIFSNDIILPTAEKVDHIFLGWYDEKGTKWETVVSGTHKDLELTAKWEEIVKYTITFDTDSGTEIPPITLEPGQEVIAPEDPTKDGHTFTGWDKEIPTTMPNENITITAKWEEIPVYVVDVTSKYGDVIKNVESGQVGEVVTFKINPYILYKVVSVKVNDVDLLPNEDGEYSFAISEGENKISVLYEVDDKQLEIIAKNIANIKNGDWEDVFTFENLAQIITWIITIFFSGGFLTVLLKNKKIQSKTTDDVIGITNNTIDSKFEQIINNFLENKLEPVLTKIDSKLVSTDDVCKTLARCFILSQENTPESRLAIINELTTLQKTSDDLSKQVKAVILEEVEKLAVIEEKKKETIKELEETNNSINPEEIKNNNIGRY